MHEREFMDYKKRDRKTLTKRINNFVRQGEEKYGVGRYDYSLARKVYKNNRIPVPLLCNVCKSKGFVEPFMVIPSRHTERGDNQRGSCPNCYVNKISIQESRWDPNRRERIEDLIDRVNRKYNGTLKMPHIEDEYKNESSMLTVICISCDSKPFRRQALSLKSKTRKGGCAVCNKKANQERTNQAIRERQERNISTQNEPRPYGCIYKITNNINGKFYIGYTTMSAEKRFKAHMDETRRMQRKHPGKSSYLHNAMNYHGFEHFSVEILEEFTDVTPLFLGKLEIQYIAQQKPHYNLSPGGEIANHANYNNKRKKAQ